MTSTAVLKMQYLIFKFLLLVVGVKCVAAGVGINKQPTPGLVALHPNTSFGGSSTNPVGFGGSVVMNNHYPPAGPSRRPFNVTRVEKILAECSDEYMTVTIHYNGSFTGLVYSSGYFNDPDCIYVNGTGRNSYQFRIRLNQCGTFGREEFYNPKMPGEARRRDQVMWNSLSIQYNKLIEEDFDEHYRVTCEYGADFWKTVTFPAVAVEVNTGSPVVFTVNPPQCQMEIRRGFGTSGTRTAGPVTVGDPLTLHIHMKSEKAGFDILVKNCIAHNGAHQKLQLIDPNGCVTNEKLISPFRGTYNGDEGHEVTLYSYLKAFRFTGSPALYLECDIHMCHNRCPPQRCYWRNLSKRSADDYDEDEELDLNESSFNETSSSLVSDNAPPLLSESVMLFQALEVTHEISEMDSVEASHQTLEEVSDNRLCFRPDSVAIFLIFLFGLLMTSVGTSVGCWLRIRRLPKYKRHVTSPSIIASSSGSMSSSSDTASIVASSKGSDYYANLAYDPALRRM